MIGCVGCAPACLSPFSQVGQRSKVKRQVPRLGIHLVDDQAQVCMLRLGAMYKRDWKPLSRAVYSSGYAGMECGGDACQSTLGCC